MNKFYLSRCKKATFKKEKEMIKGMFEKIVAKLEVTNMENYLEKDPLIEKEIELFSKDIQETISFF